MNSVGCIFETRSRFWTFAPYTLPSNASEESSVPLFARPKTIAKVRQLIMKQTLLRSFGIVIKRRREHLALSQQQLAARSDLHRTYISDIERGARNVSFDSIYSIAKGLGILPSLLFAEAELNAYKSAGEQLSEQSENGSSFENLAVAKDGAN